MAWAYVTRSPDNPGNSLFTLRSLGSYDAQMVKLSREVSCL
jgi:hypothetical protein